jgi:hypothetical protein
MNFLFTASSTNSVSYSGFNFYNNNETFKNGCIIRNVSGFVFGGCAAKAFHTAFKCKVGFIDSYLDKLGLDYNNGLYFDECTTVIKLLSKRFRKSNRYTKNINDISYYDFVKTHPTGTYICSIDNHLSCVKNGVIYDAYYYYGGRVRKLEGWWKIF